MGMGVAHTATTVRGGITMQTPDLLDQRAKKAAETYMGQFAWPTAILGVVVLLAYICIPLLVINGQMSLWLAVPLYIFLTYAAYTVMHDAAHGSINGSHTSLRWLNDLLGYMAGFILMIPLTAHRHEHLAHHRNTNDADGDPDFVVRDMTKSPFHAARAAVRIVTGQYSYYLAHRWAKDPISQRARFLLELTLALAVRIGFMAQGYWLVGAVLFMAGGVGGIALLMYLFAYIVHTPHESVGRYVDTSTFEFPEPFNTPITWLWGFQNYHSIHHLFPRVPFYHYRKLFNDIRSVMIAKGAPIYGPSSQTTGLQYP
jgi:beta-carotene hydroxylase